MAYIYAGPGSANKVTLTVKVAGNGADTGLEIPALQDITLDASNDTFTWSTLADNAKSTVVTTSNNTLSGNIVLDSVGFFGTDQGSYGASTAASGYGIFGLSSQKVRVTYELFMGEDTGAGADLPTITGAGYITGISPALSADSPVWVSGFSIVGDADPAASIA